jgi:recombinational DNA repair protein (RecF pathway)
VTNALKTEAIILRTRRFSESSLVATLLGRESGRLDVLAKGCRREKSPMYGHLDLYQKEHVLVLRRTQASLDLLTEAAFVDEHVGLRFSPPAFAAAGLLADLAAEATLPGEPVAQFYDVLAGALGVLSGLGDAGARAGLQEPLPFTPQEKTILIGRTLKLSLMDMLGWLGFGLELGRCTVCGVSADEIAGGNGKAALSHRQGGLVCGKCSAAVRDAVSIGTEGLASLRTRGEGGEGSELRLSANERRRWLNFLVDYAQHSLEKPLRGRKVLSQLL